jgi:REP element-mobilizing transposase RayT
MILNQIGRIVSSTWVNLPKHYENIDIDEYIVMPNHIHGVIAMSDLQTPLEQRTIKSHSLGVNIGSFKTWSARKINALTNRTGKPVWQRSFYDHIIRNEKSLDQIREYIINNPSQWGLGENDY